MELRRDPVVTSEYGRELAPVVSCRHDRRFVGRGTVIGVHEIEEGAIRDAVEQRMLAASMDLVPAHVRDFEAREKALHSPRNDVEAGMPAALFATSQERLQAHADAEKRPPGGDVLA